MEVLSFLTACLIAAFFPSCFCVPLIRALAPRMGLVDQPGRRKVHQHPTPLGGGIALAIGIAAPMFALYLAPAQVVRISSGFQTLLSTLDDNPTLSHQMTAIVAGGTILFLVGLADDRWNIPWQFRLLTQLGVATSVTAAGIQATVFVTQPWIGFAVTVLWIVVLTNALNFLDNMDALSAGISLIACMVFAGILLTLVPTPHWVVAFGLLITSGALGGFLVWNRPPASIFMGDSGSNLIGFLLATLTVSGTFYETSGSRHVILAPLCVLAIPLYDFCTVILIRLRHGRSPFHGDKSHFSHRLVDVGLKPAHAVLTIHLATLMTGLGGLLLYKIKDWTGAFMVIALIFCVLSVVAILETAGRRSAKRHREAMASRSVDLNPTSGQVSMCETANTSSAPQDSSVN
ncbi:MAG: undecaprenyl/decaprenyl-phosphate alpha-N-acetylglucosaminyl 1-phosphate transferase [Fuerstiella sp.]|nr:undecaprenyl/decaprenyl-phosphate alpha-N-acetylglucosaminyl 1-phosphate transferase [Fuerstiella sp.]